MRVTRVIIYLFKSALIICGVVTFMFAGVNFAAHEWIERHPPSQPRDIFGHVIWPGSPEGDRFLTKVFPDLSAEEIVGRRTSVPGFVMHPVLHYATAPISNAYFRIGVEGVRYEPGWTDDVVRQALRAGEGTVFAFGGSTMLGHGVAGDETIAAFMNRLGNGEPRVLNLGSQAYDQHREIEKLVYLLRAGYRPSQVVFLDGWNDILDMARTNMRTADKVIFHGFSENRGEIAFTPEGRVRKPDYNSLLASSLPALRLIQRFGSADHSIESIPSARDGLLDGFDFAEAEFVFWNWEAFAVKHQAVLKESIVDYYRNNLRLIQALADGFGFTATVFYQPMGLLDARNPFITTAARRTPGFQYVEVMDATVREAIRAGQLTMIDLSQKLIDYEAPKYIDVAHYSPQANRRIAELIKQAIATVAPQD